MTKINENLLETFKRCCLGLSCNEIILIHLSCVSVSNYSVPLVDSYMFKRYFVCVR